MDSWTQPQNSLKTIHFPNPKRYFLAPLRIQFLGREVFSPALTASLWYLDSIPLEQLN